MCSHIYCTLSTQKEVVDVFKGPCKVCKGTGVCDCGGKGCSKCGVKDGLSGVYKGNKVGECPACKGTGKA